MNPFSTRKWQVIYKHGGGTSYVYGDTEHEAKLNALAAYRKRLTMLSDMPLDSVVKAVIEVD